MVSFFTPEYTGCIFENDAARSVLFGGCIGFYTAGRVYCWLPGPPWGVFTLSGFLSLIRHCSNRYSITTEGKLQISVSVQNGPIWSTNRKSLFCSQTNHITSDDLAVTFKGHQKTIYEAPYIRAHRLTYGANWVVETVFVVQHATPHHPRISSLKGHKYWESLPILLSFGLKRPNSVCEPVYGRCILSGSNMPPIQGRALATSAPKQCFLLTRTFLFSITTLKRKRQWR